MMRCWPRFRWERTWSSTAIWRSSTTRVGRSASAGPEAFWWFRFDYYCWTGWGHDGGYGCQIPQRIDLVPGYRWRGHAAVDTLVSHSGHNSLRLVAHPGDNFGVLGPVVEIDGNQPFEIGAWVRADRIHQVEFMAVNADTNEYILMDSDHFAGLEAVGVNAGSKGQGTYDWTYLRKLDLSADPRQTHSPHAGRARLRWPDHREKHRRHRVVR